jgi:prepilin-type N-terminal cleavage/methylation domain-containing protein
MKKKAFTLIEVIVAVSILGILAAIVLPMFLGSSVQTKEAAARDALHMMRSQIELYRFEHKGVVPGYINGFPATITVLTKQFTMTTSITGTLNPSTTPTIPTSTYLYGPYVQKLPVNPFNNLSTIKIVPSATAFPAAADKTTGWLYKKETAEFKLNWTGTDATGKAYTDY